MSGKTLRVYLIKPSLYDEEGYVVRFMRGVLPSNTLACLNGLCEDVNQNRRLGPGVEIETVLLDEIVDLVRPGRLIEEARKFTGVSLFCLCGVQSNMFPRAADIARELSGAGHPVMIGGFHISGIISVFKGPTEEMEDLMDAGVTLVAGEVEQTWGELLRAAYQGRLKTFYNFMESRPGLDTSYLPVLNKGYLKKFALKSFGTMDCGRGCPYRCSFCTIINVHGKTMRQRDTENLKIHFLRNYRENGIKFYFFTDDNFARNPNWEKVFDILIEIQAQEGIEIEFMMQVDTQAYKIPGFVDGAVRAGCTQVFVGMESLNAENLNAVGKKQNKVGNYRLMVETWRARGVMTHVGYIIGFPFDSPESVKENIQDLWGEVGVDLASFFVLTPLPGSEDHRALVEGGIEMSEDLNRFDSFQPVTAHPAMSGEEWKAAYDFAWKYYYSHERMDSVLKHLRGDRLADMLGSFLWYKYSIVVHGTHPMVCGFHRYRDRLTRRPGFGREGRLRFMIRRCAENIREFYLTAGIALEFLALYLGNRKNLKIKVPRGSSRIGDGGIASGDGAGRRPGVSPARADVS